MIRAFLLGFFILVLGARAATLSSDGSSSDVQSKIGSAQAGDTITVPAGTFSNWTVNINKAITLAGAGSTRSIIQCPAVPASLVVNTPDGSGTVRVTGLRFDAGSTGSCVLVKFFGGGPALVDHCEFIAGSASEMIHNEAYGPETVNKAKGWSNNVTPGSADAVYIEDCTFSKNPFVDQYFWGTSALQSYYGGRTVFRHNILNFAQVDQHGTPGMIGARWFEIYSNQFNTPNAGQCCFIVLRGGSGVVYDNQLSGPGGAIQLYDENNGSSPLYLGRGINQNPSPVYLWGNASGLSVGSGSSNVQSGRDYFNSSTQPGTMKRWQLSSDNANTTYSYKPLAYPHPMTGGGPTPTPNPTPTPAPTPTATPTPAPTIPPVSTKFKSGDSVMASPNQAYVRANAGGNLLGTQPAGTIGVVGGAPAWGTVPDTGAGIYWWNVNFPTGSDGWVGEDNLVKAPVTPTPSPTATPTPIPGAVSYHLWNASLNTEEATNPSPSALMNWINANPPKSD